MHEDVGMFVALGGGANHLHEAVSRIEAATSKHRGHSASSFVSSMAGKQSRGRERLVAPPPAARKRVNSGTNGEIEKVRASLVGSWEKQEGSPCAAAYRTKSSFSSGPGSRDTGPEQRFIWWDVGRYEGGGQNQIRIQTASDEFVQYGFSISGKALTFVDPNDVIPVREPHSPQHQREDRHGQYQLSPAPPPKTVDGLAAVPIDIQQVTAALTFRRRSLIGARGRHCGVHHGSAERNPIFDLRQTITDAWLDGAPLPVTTCPPRFWRRPQRGPSDVESCWWLERSRLRVKYTLAFRRFGRRELSAGDDISAGPRLAFNFGFTDLGAGRYLEAWIPANLIFDQFSLC